MDVKEVVEVALMTLATEKVVGPSLELMGQGIAERGKRNVLAIIEKARRRLKGTIEQPGQVPPRVVGALLTDGQFVEDELTAEYFGGILAGSRGLRERDDRGASLMKLLERLSTYQVRAHYVLYRFFRDVHGGSGASMGTVADRNKLAIFVPFEVFHKAMEFSEEEGKDYWSILDNVVFGLVRESLLDDHFEFGSAETVGPRVGESAHGGVIVRPSVLGAELFMWGHGQGSMNRAAFFADDPKQSELTMDPPINLPIGSRKAEKPPAI